MKASVKIILAVLCIALIIGAVSAKGNPPGNTGKSDTLFINLTEKDSSVVAPNGAWGWILNGGFGKLQYKTAPGASFVFNAAKMMPYTEYALISYAEPYPGTGSTILGTAVSDGYGAVSIKGKTDVTTGFVCNRYPTPTSNEYLVNGTKIWLVPTSDLSMPLITSIGPSFGTTYFTTWNDADYLFETDLVNKGCIVPEASCESGFGNCDGYVGNGCETDFDTDTANCGSCGTACSVADGTPSCIAGTCAIGSCNTDFGDCDGQYGNGCEIDLRVTTDACGSCDVTCPAVTNGAPSCSGGQCGFTCNGGFEDCNTDVSDGCETDLSLTDNCGSCGNACISDEHTEQQCSGGFCVLDYCNGDYDDCNDDDVCETDLTSIDDCGWCGNVCSDAGGNPSCYVGSCSIECSSPYADCDAGSENNGCEIDLSNDADNCGGCGNACTSDDYSSPNGCSDGSCSYTCDEGYADCNEGNSLSAPGLGDFTELGEIITPDGCETPVTTIDNCGECGNTCPDTDGTPACDTSTGTCYYETCNNSDLADCNMDEWDGCETDLTTDKDCGACWNECGYGWACTDPESDGTWSCEDIS